MGKKRALVVGINDYPGTLNDLPSCVNDAHAMEAILRESYSFTDVKVILDADATQSQVEAGLKWLFKDGVPGDNLCFYFSGHGAQNQESGNLEEALVLHDGLFSDDRLVALAKDLPEGVATFCIDACFSGGMEKKVFQLVADQTDISRNKFFLPSSTDKLLETANPKARVQYRPFGCFPISVKLTPKGLVRAFASKAADDDEAGQPRLNGLLITASKENEVAAASSAVTEGLSAFTWAFRDVLLQAGNNASVDSLVASTNEVLHRWGFSQTALVKARPDGLSQRCFLSSRVASKGFRFHGGGGISTPLGGGSFQFGAGSKDWSDLVEPVVREVIRELTKGQGVAAPKFGWEALLVPVVTEVIRQLTKGQGLGTVNAPEQKAWQDLIGPIVLEVVRELTKSPQLAASKLALEPILIPLAMEILQRLLGHKGALPQAFASSPDVNTKDWTQLIVPVVTEVIRALSKSPVANSKIGAEALILPIALEVLRALLGHKSVEAWNGVSSTDSKAWEDLIGPVVREILNAIAGGNKSALPLPDPFPGRDFPWGISLPGSPLPFPWGTI